MDSGKKSTGTTAAAAARRKGQVGGRGSSSAAGLFPVRRGSDSAAVVLPVRRGSGPAAGLLPVGRGSGPAAPLFAVNGSNNAASAPLSSMAAFGAKESAPTGGFNSHGGDCFDGSTASPPAGFPFPPSPSQAWWGSHGASPASSSFVQSDPTWDNNSHPPGGFMGILNSQPNLHFGGSPSHYAPFKAPRCADVGGNSPPDVEMLSNKQHVVLDEEDENVRTEKRIMWTPDEDERLMSAWIEHSTDSAKGADRKGEAYWGDVIKAYNKETPPQRKRNAKQAKDRWHKINRWCDLFESDYVKARRVFTSGYSDDMWTDAAEKFYLEHKLGPFVIKNVWKICRDVAKWKT